LGVDLLRSVYLYEQGESLSSIIENAASESMTSFGSTAQPTSELYELVLAQSKAIGDLQAQVKELSSQLSNWMDKVSS
jgi:hypothetical protein